jgi:hypothetical protein
MRINLADEVTLDQAGIQEGMKIHLQDEIAISKKSKFASHHFNLESNNQQSNSIIVS